LVYELLLGLTPWDAQSEEGTLAQIKAADVVWPPQGMVSFVVWRVAAAAAWHSGAVTPINPFSHACPVPCIIHSHLPQLDPDAESLLRGLLTRDPKQRLGSSGVQQIQQHPFFAGVAWSRLVADVEQDQRRHTQLHLADDDNGSSSSSSCYSLMGGHGSAAAAAAAAAADASVSPAAYYSW
jgi:serine/threonine protein kinase